MPLSDLPTGGALAGLVGGSLGNPSNILTLALSQVGTKESPAGSNNVKYNTEYYGKSVSGGSYPWCCVFIWWLFKHIGASKLFYNGKKTASCTTLMKFYKGEGRGVSRGDYKPGDLIFYDWGKNDGYAYHIGILYKTDGTNLTQVIEGNTPLNSVKNTDGVEIVTSRRSSQVVYVARPAYSTYNISTNTAASAGEWGASSFAQANQSGSGGYNDSYSSIISDNIVPSGEYYEAVDMSGVVSDWLYGRRYRVVIGTEDGALDVSQLRCTFEIVQSVYREENQSILTIYNLNPDDENALIKGGKQMIVEAGYAGSLYGKIYAGNILQSLRSKENGVDYLLTLVAIDSDRYLAYGLVSVALVAEQSARDAVNACVNKAGDITGENYNVQEGLISDKSTQIIYPRGKILFGSPTDYLSQVSASCNGTYYAEDGTINIISPEDLEDDEIFELNPENGLLGTPTQTEYGISCECLLNPLIKINTLFRIDNKKIKGYQYTPGNPVRSLDQNGIYRVIKLTHIGDTRGTDWKTKIDAVAQAGILPGMMTGSSSVVF